MQSVKPGIGYKKGMVIVYYLNFRSKIANNIVFTNQSQTFFQANI
jgi:hypothetical protein